MKADEIEKGGKYKAKISGRIVTIRVDSIEESETRRLDRYSNTWKYGSRTIYNVTNLATNRTTIFKSAQKFRSRVLTEIPAPIQERKGRTFKTDRQTYRGFNRDWSALDLEHVVLYTVDGELEALAIDDPRKVGDVVKYLADEGCGQIKLLGSYSRK